MILLTSYYAENLVAQNRGLDMLSVLSSAGSSYQNNDVSISWSLGNTLIGVSDETPLMEKGTPLKQIEEPIVFPTALKYYPNPVEDILVLSYQSENTTALLSYTVSVYDLNGKLVSFYLMDHPNVQLNLSNLPNSFYVLNVTNVKGEIIESFKIIKN